MTDTDRPSSEVFSGEDRDFMNQAMALAEQAQDLGEVPVGAVVVLDGQVIGRGFNQPIAGHDPTAHAEIQAIREACQQQQNYRLPGATLYVTLEPCAMCAGAIVHARIERLVFAAIEPKAGAVESTQRFFSQPQLNHRVAHAAGLEQEAASTMLSDFFRRRREQRREQREQQRRLQRLDDAADQAGAGNTGAGKQP